MISEHLKNYKVLLASSSKRRHELLKELEINFQIVFQKIEESYPKNLIKSEITDFLSKKNLFHF